MLGLWVLQILLLLLLLLLLFKELLQIHFILDLFSVIVKFRIQFEMEGQYWYINMTKPWN